MLFVLSVALNLLFLHKITLEMKTIFILITCFWPAAIFAQSVWEKPSDSMKEPAKEVKEKKAEKPDPDEKYLAGAVTENNGKVEWKLDVDVPGKSAGQIYDIMFNCLTELTKSDNQLEGSCVSLVNKQDHIIVASVREWLVFKENFLMLDRTKFFYTLIAYCKDGHLTLTMGRIAYKYEEERDNGGSTYKAEEWINDENALNKKKTKLLLGSAKFRRKTIDRKDFIFNTIRETVLK